MLILQQLFTQNIFSLEVISLYANRDCDIHTIL